MTIRSVQVEFTLPLEDLNLFPEVPEIGATSYHVVQSRDLKALIRRTTFAADTQSTRYALGGALIELNGDSIALVATDGRRLARMPGPARAVNNPALPAGPSVIPIKALSLIDDILDDDDGPVFIGLTQTGLFVHAEGIVEIRSRLLEGRFPAYQDVFPKTIQGNAQLDAGSLLAAVRQGAVVLDENHTGIELHFDAGSLRLVGQGDDSATCRAELATTHEGERVTMLLDPRFLIEALQMLRGQTRVVIEWADSKSPLVLRTPDGCTNLIMPMTSAA
jgi:DNA polymerase-3 subunit beta